MGKKIFRKQGFFLMLLGFMLALLMAGCGTDSAIPGNNTDNGTLTIAGSTSVQPFSDVLAEKFMNQNSDVRINVQGGGSSQGVTAVLSSVADIGAVSRNLKEEEKNKGDLVTTKLAIDGVAIVVHPSNITKGLTLDEVRDIYLGKIKNWKELGGEDVPITVVSREEGSGTREAFTKIVMNKEDIKPDVLIQNANGAVRSTVAGDKNSIAYLSLAYVDSTVKALDIDGVAANVKNVQSGEYKLQRPFLYITNGQPSGLAKAYLDFVLSEEGQDIVEQEGAISVK